VNDTFDSAPKGDGQALFVVGRTGTTYALAVPSSRSSPPASSTTPSSEPTTGSPAPDQTTPTAPDQERRQSP
jgi:hypothetical protein